VADAFATQVCHILNFWNYSIFSDTYFLAVDVYEELEEEDTVVHLENVHKTYLLGLEGVPALRGVTVRIKRGEWVTIFGTSGGGKTSMLNIIGTIDKPTKGEVKLCGIRVNNKTADERLAFIRREKLYGSSC
jgi:putative ABC transport system ATP-binding protein